MVSSEISHRFFTSNRLVSHGLRPLRCAAPCAPSAAPSAAAPGHPAAPAPWLERPQVARFSGFYHDFSSFFHMFHAFSCTCHAFFMDFHLFHGFFMDFHRTRGTLKGKSSWFCPKMGAPFGQACRGAGLIPSATSPTALEATWMAV